MNCRTKPTSVSSSLTTTQPAWPSGQPESLSIPRMFAPRAHRIRAGLNLHSRWPTTAVSTRSVLFISEFRHRRLQNEGGPVSTAIPQRIQSGMQERAYNLGRRQPDVGFTSLERRTEELDLYLAWSGYTTEYTTSAEYPSFRAHSRAEPSIE
ncbi:hypothetical protein SBA3_2910030 [Candidatus Sulfopaludibacter sp. SbA3]|nr:hypothetical protein SBA3_2910030 [Candidatus Sulfopaludibacter sp. SbA3]